MKVARIREPHVRRFVQRVVPGGRVGFVQYEPLASAPEKECFRIVPEQVARVGGEQVVGWALWEWRKVMLIAEFHAVWRDLDGHLVDLTPRPIELHKIAFVPDSQRHYKGVQVDNVREPLRDDPLITRFIALEARMTELLNEGDLAEQYGEIPATPEMLDVEDEMKKVHRALVERYGRPY